MNKTTITLLAVAGIFALAGCKHEVMQDRQYAPAGPQEDPAVKQQPAAAPQTELPPAQAGKKQEAEPVQELRYQPMSGSYSNDGIADDAAPRKKSAKSGKSSRAGKGSKAATAQGGVYIVKPKDTLGRIAAAHKVSLTALREANDLDPKRDKFLRVGTKLTIPGSKKAAAGKSSAKKASRSKGIKNSSKLNADGTYTMVRGDSIPKVARKFGIRARALQRANNLTDEETTKLQIGHKLIIPTGDDAVVGKAKSAKGKRTAPKAAAKKAEVKEQTVLPPAAPTEETAPAAALPPAAPAAPQAETGALPPAAPAADTVNVVESSNFVAAGDAKTLAEFAAKHNTSVEELCKLNPQLDPAAPLDPNKMLFIPKK